MSARQQHNSAPRTRLARTQGLLWRRQVTAAELARIGVPRSRLRMQDAVRDALAAVIRSPLRTVLTSTGTAPAVGTAVATIGLSDSASGAVSATFNALQATIVTFSNNNSSPVPPELNETAEKRLDRLNGVAGSGLVWILGGGGAGQLYPVGRTAPQFDGQPAELPVAVASPGGLATIGATVSAGRLYDSGMDHRGDSVVLLGSAAARQLGISGLGESPVIYIGEKAFTVIGIISKAPIDPQVLLGVIVAPGVAAAIAGVKGADASRQMIVRTAPGAAQLIGRQGPYAIDPLHPGRILASVPVNPAQLREAVSASLTSLLLAIALVAFAIGLIAIANTSLLSVIQRRPEIGLRRSLGAAPRHIAVLVVLETALTGTIGGVLGTSVGVFITSGVSASRGWAPVLDPRLLLSAPAAGAVAGMLAGLYPAWRASRVSPISALQQ